MKKALLLLPVLFMHAVIYAQDSIPAFGKINIADLQMKECPFEKGAPAMGLIKTENIKVSIDENTQVLKTNTEYRVRIKIFTESGFSNANIVIPYSTSRSTRMTDIEAYIYNADDQGKIVAQKVDKNQIFNERAKSKKSSHSMRFTFPGLKKGSIIEYRYATEDKNSVDIHPWFFQEEMPSLFSQCIITMPVYMQISYHFAGTMPMEKDSSYIRNSNSQYLDYQQSFTMRAVPAFRPEPFMSSFKDNLQRIEFAVSSKNVLTTSGAKFRWALYNDMLLGSPFFGLQFGQNIPATTLFVDSVKKLKHAEDRISAAYNYVKRNVNWNGEQTFFSEDINECLKDKSGSSAEMNILLINLLRKAGVPSYPLLISTRENGRLDQSFPSLGQFNGVDVLVINGDQVYVLDCVQKNLSYKTTPFNILNCEAMLVDRSNSKWVRIADSRVLMSTELNLNAKIDSAGVMSGAADIKFSGIAKAEIIAEEEKDEKEKAHTRDLIDEDATDLKIDSSLVLHRDDDNDTLIRKINFHYTLSNTGDVYFLNPFVFSMFKKDPFKDSSRVSDIDFGTGQSYSTQLVVSVPGDFAVEELPEPVFVHTADSGIVFKREIISTAGQVIINNSVNINRALFTKEEYKTVKLFFDKIYALINEQVVLKRKE